MTEIFVASINGICIVIAALIGRKSPIYGPQSSGNNTKGKPVLFWIVTFFASITIGVFTYFAFGWVIDDKKVAPIEVPKGFGSVSWSAGELGIAVPEKWWVEPSPYVLTFDSPIKDQRFSIWIYQLDTISIRKLEANYQEKFKNLSVIVKQFFPMLEIKGDAISRPHQGFPGFAVTATMAPPDEQPSEITLHIILDEKKERMLMAMYTKSAISKQIMSTLNLR